MTLLLYFTRPKPKTATGPAPIFSGLQLVYPVQNILVPPLLKSNQILLSDKNQSTYRGLHAGDKVCYLRIP